MATLAPAPLPLRRAPLWRRFFEPAPPAAEPLTNPAQIQAGFRAWQTRVLIWSTVGYGIFYFVRKNLSVAMPLMQDDLGFSETSLGLFLTLHSVLYGVSKFANGFVGDRCNARSLMVLGLAASALMNFLFGWGSAAATLGVIWMCNGWFQGMGFPPCARLLSHWFTPKTFAQKMSIWNMSHSVGAALILLLCGYVLAPIDWRLCFWVPGGIALACACVLWFTLPDTPPSVGLPEVEGTQRPENREHPPSPRLWRTGRREDREQRAGEANSRWFSSPSWSLVFSNPYIWLVSVTNFFVYILRYGVLDWGPTILTKAKHLDIGHASFMVAGFELAGAVGALLAGWITDRFFGGRAMRICVFYMVLAGGSLFLFWNVAGSSRLANTALLCAAGFFIYGPQCLVAVAAAKLATKQAAATAVGLTGIFGYFSSVLSGWGLGYVAKNYGWNTVFAGLIAVAVIGTLLCVACWNAKADGYQNASSEAN